MKTLITILCAIVLSLNISAEESKGYTQFDTFRFTIDNKDAKTFTKNMRAHIKKYHEKAPFKTKIWNVLYGEDTNQYIWAMGPTSYAEMDARPEDKSHEDDWENNINPYIKSYNQIEVWRIMDGTEINNMKEGDKAPEMYSTRYFTSAAGSDGDEISNHMKKVKATLDKIGKVNYWAVMDNQFIQGRKNGRHMMAIWAMNSMAELDEDWEFAKHFDELHGDGSFEKFLDNYNKLFENSWQEIITLNKKMSGM